MRAVHTPGPWCASVGAGHVAVMVGRTIDSTLAITTTCTPEGVANARLMAAAPTMLDALQRLIPWACKAMSDGVHVGCAAPNDLNASINLARYAIARATWRPVAQGEATQPNPDPSQPHPDPLATLRDVLDWYAHSTDADGDMPPELHARLIRAVGGEVAA